MNIEKVKLKDGSEHPLGGNWNNLTDKPFYENTTEIASMPETELTFAYQKDINRYVTSNENSSDIVDKWSGDWNKATVVFDGISYIVSKNTFEGMSFIGDFFRVEAGFPITGEPFAIKVNNGALKIVSFTDATPENPDNVPNVTHTVGITLVNEMVKKLDDIYQHQPDWDNANRDSASNIKNRPFGLMAEDGYVWAEKDVVWSTEGGARISGIDFAPLLCAEKILLEVDGEKYISSEINSGDGIPDGAIEVLFVDADGNSAYAGLVYTKELTQFADVFTLASRGESSLTDGQTVHVKVAVFGSRKQIDKDYLPILDKKSSNIVSSLVKFTYDSELGNWVSSNIEVTQELYNRLVNDFLMPEICVDSDKYIGTGAGGSESSGYSSGNPHLLNTYDNDNGIPYAIKVVKNTVDDVITYILTIRLVGDAPEDISMAQTHYINLQFIGYEKDTCTINRDYLPELPEFDLTAMGLGTVVPGGGQQSVTCDVTDLISAMKKGTVKLCLNTILGTDSNGTPKVTPFNIIGNAIYLKGSLYEIISSASYYGTNMQVLVWVNEEEGKLYSLATIDEPPTFNLTNMGLPEIPMDGTVVSVSCDTTGLITALNKGTVKLISKVKFSDTVTHDYTCIANSGFIGNEYNCTMCGVISGLPRMISFAATPSKISAYITALAVPTTTTTETGTT